MLITNRLLRRLTAVSLALLLLLCSGCGSAPAPSADTPEPSQALDTPAPTDELPPEPTPAASPTDVNAPAAPLPKLETPVERKKPEYVNFLSQGLHFTATDADGRSFSYDGAEGSGSIEGWSIHEADGTLPKTFDGYIKYSSRISCELSAAPEEGDEWALELISASARWYNCFAIGNGKPQYLEYDCEAGELTVRCEVGSKLKLVLAVPDSVLGEGGWIRLMFISGEEEVKLRADGNTLYFSGLDPAAPDPAEYGLSPEQPAFLEYNGYGLSTVKFSSGSGTLDLSGLLDGPREITAGPAEG